MCSSWNIRTAIDCFCPIFIPFTPSIARTSSSNSRVAYIGSPLFLQTQALESYVGMTMASQILPRNPCRVERTKRRQVKVVRVAGEMASRHMCNQEEAKGERRRRKGKKCPIKRKGGTGRERFLGRNGGDGVLATCWLRPQNFEACKEPRPAASQRANWCSVLGVWGLARVRCMAQRTKTRAQV